MPARDDPFGEIEQLFEQFSQLGDPLGGQLGGGPPVDLVDAGDELVVSVDLPGRDPETLSVQLTESQTLKIEAARDETRSDGRFVKRERTREAVSRSISLPAAVDESKTEANYDRGVLTVRLQKLERESEGTDIPVN